MNRAPTTRSDRALTVAELADRLLPLLSDLFSPKHSPDSLLATLASLRRAEQDSIVHWIGIIARLNAELAYQFAVHAPRARARMSLKEMEDWVLQAMDVYDHQGLYAAVHVLSHLNDYLARRDQQRSAVHLKQIGRVLEAFLHGLSGRALTVAAGDTLYTDTETIYLPASMRHFPTRDENFSLAKCLAALLWAQTRYGSFALADDGALHIQALLDYDDGARAQELFAFFEGHRLLSCIETELPGLAREIRLLIHRYTGGDDYRKWHAMLPMLLEKDASVVDSLKLVHDYYPQKPPPTPFGRIVVNIETAKTTIAARMVKERDALLQALGQLAQQAAPPVESSARIPAPTPGIDQRFRLLPGDGINENGNLEIGLSLDGKPMQLTPALLKLLQSILQDLGTLPTDYLAAASGNALPQSAPLADSDVTDTEVLSGEPFPEWDYRRRHYRRDWCFVREIDVTEADAAFVGDTLDKYASALPRLRKTFEALRSEERWLCRQRLGDDLDLDALVDALVDQQAGREPDDRVYKRLSRNNRNIAVLFMIDMSGSTKGWVNEAEREALVLLCEALQILGDRYAIYGFSGMTRRRCEIFKVKQFDESYSDAVRGRIAGIEARDYTRMGVSIRYLNKLLEAVPARTKLLITLSDGKPDDFDGYGGDYGIEDTRQALIESRQAGIHPFCVTIDREARDYLPHMYGRHSYAVIDEVQQLPLKVADIYRRLTI